MSLVRNAILALTADYRAALDKALKTFDPESDCECEAQDRIALVGDVVWVYYRVDELDAASHSWFALDELGVLMGTDSLSEVE